MPLRLAVALVVGVAVLDAVWDAVEVAMGVTDGTAPRVKEGVGVDVVVEFGVTVLDALFGVPVLDAVSPVLDAVWDAVQVAMGVTDGTAPRVKEGVGVAVGVAGDDWLGAGYCAYAQVSRKAPVTPWGVRGAQAGTRT